ncbi:hypothetical protein N7523_005726 [Penicillium sp. IBT 18751x]|nr:hypothetical protein N7523_005679 [Penicillium sp. IBT 18751x]KAJ6117975.1 hypothetical protein N7523_005726 [Penicillium sp. IBT 18751x]
MDVGVFFEDKILAGEIIISEHKSQTRLQIIHALITYCASKALWEEKPQDIYPEFLRYTHANELWDPKTKTEHFNADVL